MSARDVYNAAVKAAEVAKIATKNINLTTAQETVNAQGIGMGNNPARGANAAMIVAQINANAAYVAAQLLAEMTKQVAVDAAKNVLRAAGDPPT